MDSVALLEQIDQLEDPRRETLNKWHPLRNVLGIALCSVFCGCEKFTEMEEFGKAMRSFFERFLDLGQGIPSHDTFGRVFAAIEPKALMACLSTWVRGLGDARGLANENIAIDGKAMRGAGGQGTVHRSARGRRKPDSRWVNAP